MTWDGSQLQAGTFGLLTNFRGGTPGIDLGTAVLEDERVAVFVQLEEIFPGCSQYIDLAAPRGRFWPGIDTARGSYSSYGMNEWSVFGGIEADTEGRVYFAGEHTSMRFKGYMNGAAQTGAEAAQAILASL